MVYLIKAGLDWAGPIEGKHGRRNGGRIGGGGVGRENGEEMAGDMTEEKCDEATP